MEENEKSLQFDDSLISPLALSDDITLCQHLFYCGTWLLNQLLNSLTLSAHHIVQKLTQKTTKM
jgi:hypothetical protein